MPKHSKEHSFSEERDSANEIQVAAFRLKLGIVIALVLLTIVILWLSYRNSWRAGEEQVLLRLEGITSTLALTIDGDMVQSLIEKYPEEDDITANDQDEDYQKLHNMLLENQKTHSLKTPIYLLVRDHQKAKKNEKVDAFFFAGISGKPNWRHKYTPPDTLMNDYFEGGRLTAYKDKHGTWLSAFSPIYNSKNEVVAVVQADNPFDDFVKKIRLQVLQQLAILWSVFIVVLIALYRFVVAFSKKLTRAHSTVQSKNAELVTAYDELSHKNQEIQKAHLQVKTAHSTVQSKNNELVIAYDELSHKNQEIQKAHLQVNEKARELRMSLEKLSATQNELVQAQKMAAMGQLVAGVAHELNTPLGIAVTGASSLQFEIEELQKADDLSEIDPEDLEDGMDTINEASKLILSNLKRAADLVKSFKRLAIEKEDEKISHFNIKEHLQDVMMSLKPLLKKTNILFTLDCPDKLEVSSFPGPISQIIFDLVTNVICHAYDTDEKGHISISIKSKEKDLLLKFSDDGKGMSSEVCKSIFDPFFTTQRGKGGIGLGMHLVHNLVSQVLRGTIQVESQEGKGTAFRITFPLVA